MLELCTLVPNYHSFEEAGHFMESLLSLRCEFVQTLLETCSSIKAKRLFPQCQIQKLKIKNTDFTADSCVQESI